MLFFQKQIMMRRVLIALIPVYAFAVYLYGLPLAILTAVVVPAAVITEYLFVRIRTPRGKKALVSEAAFVTAFLFLLSLPPATPFWVALIGIVFAIAIGKMAYGGFGRNIFNPALSGRLFVYIAFPNLMGGAVFLSAGNFGVDAVTAATPLALLRGGKNVDLISLVTGIHAGSFGESALVLIFAAALFLVITKTASYRIMVSTLAGALALTVALWAAGVSQAFPPLEAILSGSIFFAAVFYATDPVSAPKGRLSQWIYGAVVGISAVLIRQFSLFAEGTSFAVLLGNMFAPLFDHIFRKKPA